MPSSYSQDFRKKVINHVLKGNSCRNAALKFDIAANTVRNWYKRYNAEGHYEEKNRPGKQSRLNREEFELYVNSNPNLTLAQIGKRYNMTGRSAGYYLKKFGYTYKKKSHATWKQRS